MNRFPNTNIFYRIFSLYENHFAPQFMTHRHNFVVIPYSHFQLWRSLSFSVNQKQKQDICTEYLISSNYNAALRSLRCNIILFFIEIACTPHPIFTRHSESRKLVHILSIASNSVGSKSFYFPRNFTCSAMCWNGSYVCHYWFINHPIKSPFTSHCDLFSLFAGESLKSQAQFINLYATLVDANRS